MWAVGSIGIMRNIIEKHQPGPDRVFKIHNIQACWSLVESVTITSGIEPEQTAYDQAQGGFMGHNHQRFILVFDNNVPDHRQGTCQYTDSRLASLRCKAEWVGFPGRIL